WIVERCLTKDPEGRYASTKDLARDLASVRDHLSEASGALAAAETARPRGRGWLAPAVIALLIGAGLALLGRSLIAGRASSTLDFRRLTYQRGTVFSARFTPDGETVVYSAAWDGRPVEIFSTRIEGHESRSLGLPSAELLSISSAGEMAVSLGPRFFRGIQSAGTLARVPLGGGAPREVLENVQDADWSPDGKELAVARYVGNRCRLEYPIGHLLYEAAAWISHVRVSPDGSMVAFFDHPAPGDNTGRLRALDRNGKTRLEGPPGETGMGLAWSPRGDEIWSTSPLRATSLSGRVRAPWTLLGAQDCVYDISRSGRVLLSRNSSRREIIGSSGGGPERNLTALSYSYPLDLSSDGRQVLVSEENRVPYGIYLRKLDGSPAVRLGEGQGYQLSPDGRWAVATTAIGSDTLLFLPTGAGETRKVSLSGIACQWVSFFPDGQRVLIAGNEPGRRVRLYTMGVSGGKPTAMTGEGVSLNAPEPFSPDGRHVVAMDAEERIAIYPVGAGEPHLVPGIQPGDTAIRWSADGHSLFVFNPSTRPDIVELLDVQTGKRTVWREFRASDPAGVMRIDPFVVTSDGGSYVYSYRRILDDLYTVSGLR
ncbi:MAG TPA: hypothetical protein VIZ69_08280, partial [Thermoanaerobaculia bacterium]